MFSSIERRLQVIYYFYKELNSTASQTSYELLISKRVRRNILRIIGVFLFLRRTSELRFTTRQTGSIILRAARTINLLQILRTATYGKFFLQYYNQLRTTTTTYYYNQLSTTRTTTQNLLQVPINNINKRWLLF